MGPRAVLVVPVPHHERGGAQAHLATRRPGDRAAVGVHDEELDTGVRPAHADLGVLVGVVERGAEPDARFGAGVAHRQRGAEAGSRLSDERGSGRAAAHDHGADRA